MVKQFTKEYRDKHWRKCRFGCDLRNCGTEGRDTDGFRKNIEEQLRTDPKSVIVLSQPHSGPDNPYLVYCERDGKPCDASWKE